MNDLKTALETLANAFCGEMQRLVEVEKKYDPQNRFRFNQDIEPEA